jgi:cytochrome c oxidase cbb3-type subunit 4
MISGIFTAVLLAAFLALTAWAYSPRRRAPFDEAAALPLADDVRRDAHTDGAP